MGGWRWRWYQVALLFVAATFASISLLLAVAFDSYHLPSPSMHPTAEVGDYAIAQSFGASSDRGTVVILHIDGPVPTIISRIIGVGGDEISAQNGQVFINGLLLQEPYLKAQSTVMDPAVVPAGEIFVMSDNRTNSTDSRRFGPLPTSAVVGQVRYIGMPVHQISLGLFIAALIAASVAVLHRLPWSPDHSALSLGDHWN